MQVRGPRLDGAPHRSRSRRGLLAGWLPRGLALLLVATSLARPTFSPQPAEAAAGDLDPTFGQNGKVVMGLGAGFNSLDATAIQSDGKIVAAGSAFDGIKYQVALARFNSDGSLDGSFDGDGKLVTSLPNGGEASAVSLQADGKIVAAGVTCTGAGGSLPSNCDVLLLRFDPGGALDLSLDGDGWVTTDLSSSDGARGVAVQDDGAIVVVGGVFSTATQSDFAVIRYRPDGSLDPSFNPTGALPGSVTTPVGPGGSQDDAFAVAIQQDKMIVVAGQSAFDFALARYTSIGTLDTSFDGDGVLTTSIGAGGDFALALTLQPDGKIIAAGEGFTGTSVDWALTRYNADGTPDTSFDGDGVVTTPVGPGTDEAYAVALQPDGKAVVAGSTRNPITGDDDFALARYSPDGALDPSFGSGGIIRTDFGEDAVARALALQSDGNVVVGGDTGDFVLVRYVNDPVISVNDVTVNEGDGGTINADFIVSLSSPAGGAGVAVSYATTDATATAPGDYGTRSGTLLFAPGEMTKTISVPVNGDSVDEAGEAFFVNFASPSGAMLPDAQAVGAITDDEPLIIENAAGGPGLIERIAVRNPSSEAGVVKLCLDPRRSPCTDFSASSPATGPNPRVEPIATFQVFDAGGNSQPETRTNGPNGLDAGSTLEVTLSSRAPAADITIIRFGGAPTSIEAFYADGTSAGSTQVDALPGHSTTVRFPTTPALEVAQQPFAVAAAGDYIYVADPVNHLVRFVNPTVNTGLRCPCESVSAGNGSLGAPANGADPLLTQLAGPYAIAPIPSSPGVVPEMFIADTFGHRVLRVRPESSVPGAPVVTETIAGTGGFGFSGDGGLATNAELNSPYGVAHDPARNITYVADTLNHRVRAILPDGSVGTVAGTGTAGPGGNGGPATAAQLNQPRGLTLDLSGNLYIADTFNHSVRRLERSTGIITTVAGTGTAGNGGDGASAERARLDSPAGVAVDSASPPSLYVADTLNHRVRKVAGNGEITTVAGSGAAGFGGDGGPATRATLNSPFGVAIRPNGDILVADSLNNRVRLVSGTVITSLAGNGTPSYAGDGGPASQSQLAGVSSVSAPSSGGSSAPAVLADPFNNRVRELRPNGEIASLAGNGTMGSGGDGGPAVNAQLSTPFGVAVDRSVPSRFVYVADTFNNVVRRIDRTTGTIVRVAGDGTSGFGGDGGPATIAKLSFPTGLAVDGAGNLYVADAYNSRIRKVDTTGVITTVAGSGRLGFSGDGGIATSADLFFPYAVAVDGSNPANVYASDSFNNRIRRVDGDSGVISTVAGNGIPTFAGDGGPGPSGSLNRPWGIALDDANPTNLYVADSYNHRIRRMSGSSRRLSTVTASGVPGNQGDLGPSANALLSGPRGVLPVVPDKLFLLGDSFSNRIRRVGLPVTGASPEPVSFSATSFDVGCPTTCPTNTVTVTNVGSVKSTITNVAVTGPNASDFSVTRNGCKNAKLAAGMGCQVTITFRPAVDCPSADACRLATLTTSGNGADTVRDIKLAGQVSKPTCFGLPATITGTPGNDNIAGTAGPDVIHGGDGNDMIQGLGGDDVICAGAGDDGIDAGPSGSRQTVNGGPGNDRISGGPGNDSLEGNTGNDVIFGDDGDDYLDGAEGGSFDVGANTGGDDLLWGGDGDDTLWSADFLSPVDFSGSVQAHGGAGDDKLFGLKGNDTLIAGTGTDIVFGGEGMDYLSTKDGDGADTGDVGGETGDKCNKDNEIGNSDQILRCAEDLIIP